MLSLYLATKRKHISHVVGLFYPNFGKLFAVSSTENCVIKAEAKPDDRFLWLTLHRCAWIHFTVWTQPSTRYSLYIVSWSLIRILYLVIVFRGKWNFVGDARFSLFQIPTVQQIQFSWRGSITPSLNAAAPCTLADHRWHLARPTGEGYQRESRGCCRIPHVQRSHCLSSRKCSF